MYYGFCVDGQNETLDTITILHTFILLYEWILAMVVTLIKCLALLSSPKVVCLELSAPKGTMSFNFSRQFLR